MSLDAAAALRTRQLLHDRLRPGEELIWCGAPDRTALLSPQDSYLIPFSVIWLSFACFWEFGVSQTGAGLFPQLWGIPFICLGLYMVAGRFVYKAISHTRTAYGVTGDRALIITSRTFRDLPLAGMPISVQRSRDGRRASVVMGLERGAIRTGLFSGRRAGSYAMYANTGMEPLMRSAVWPFAFYDVPDPEPMLAAIDRARTGGANPW